VPLPPNTLAEMRRNMARLRLVREQIKIIEKSRVERLAERLREGTNPMACAPP
jgi:transposase